MLLKDEALMAQNRLSRAEVLLETIKQEKQLLQDSESRLLKEREVLHRERHTHSLIKADVESIKASLDRIQAENQLRNEQRLDDSIRECSALRRRLQEEQDQFRELTCQAERQKQNLQKSLDDEKAINSNLLDNVNILNMQEKIYIKKIEELELQLKNISTTSVQNPVEGKSSS